MFGLHFIVFVFLGVFSFVSLGENNQATQVHPIILFHGGGGGAPASVKDMSPAAKQLENLGFPKEHLYKVDYPDTKNIETMIFALAPQFRDIMARYPEGTSFDTIGHSLGHVVSLVSLAKLNLLPKIRKLIGIAGVMFGQLGGKPGLCASQVLAPHYCGDIFDLLLGTTQPKLILDILETQSVEMARIEKCSLFSPDDGVLNPYDSGAFPDGTNISLPHIKHLKFKSSPEVFRKMKESCFHGKF